MRQKIQFWQLMEKTLKLTCALEKKKLVLVKFLQEMFALWVGLHSGNGALMPPSKWSSHCTLNKNGSKD